MSKNIINRDIGFSLWLDFVERDYLKSDFPALIEKGIINGATSNPAIFASAITTSPAYKAQLESLEGKSAKAKYEALAIEDIRTAAKALRGLYDDNNDGYISIEVDPFLSHDTQGTIAEGRRLFEAIGEPNVMVKVPATDEGYEAMRVLMSEGISVNATLIFSPEQAGKCLEAMSQGSDASKGKVDAVISVFVSRFDRLLDEKMVLAGLEASRVGIYNAMKIYQMIEEAGRANIRTLFASTGVKGDSPRADYYIRELMVPHSVNTAPLSTIEAYMPNPLSKPIYIDPEGGLEGFFASAADVDIDMKEVYNGLLADGLASFEKAFQDMLDSIE